MAGLQTDGSAPLAAMSEVEAKHDSFDEKKSDEQSFSQKHDSDGIHDGLIFPTDEERSTLRRVPDSIPWNAYRTPVFVAEFNVSHHPQ
jgi:POT family proton-dependent oligopeptide transporter